MDLMTNEEQKPEENSEVESILSDLDVVLSEMGLTGASPAPAPAPAPILPPVAKSTAALSDPPAPANPAPAARPAPIKPLEVQKPPASKPVPAASTEINRPTAAGKPAPGSTQELKIEMGPAKGISSPSTPSETSSALGDAIRGQLSPGDVSGGEDSCPRKMPRDDNRAALAGKENISSGPVFSGAPQASPSSSPPEKKGTFASTYKPPLEIKLDAAAPVKPPEKNQAAAPPKFVIPPSSAVPANPPAKAAPKASPAAIPLIHAQVAPVEIPENVSKDQIRPLAFLFMAGGKAKFDEFIQFIDSMSLHFGKKPLYLRRVVVLELPATVDFQAVISEIRASGAAGTVGLLPDSIARSLEEAFSQVGSFFRFIRPEDVGKRSAALDLLVDVALLPAG